MLADGAALIVGVALTYVMSDELRTIVGTDRFVPVAIVTCLAWLIAMATQRLYVARAIERPTEEFRRIVAAGVIGAGAFIVTVEPTGFSASAGSTGLTIFIVVSVCLLLERTIARRVFARLRKHGRITRRIAIIGTDPQAQCLAESVRTHPSRGYSVVGLIGPDVAGQPVLGSIDRATEILREHGCVGAVISISSVSATDVNRLTRRLTDENFHVALSTGLRDIDLTRMRTQALDGQALLYVEPTIRSGWRSRAKRVFDIVVATFGLIVTAPFVAIAAVLIKLESDGPVLFRQERVGRHGILFDIIKLRSMYGDAEGRRGDLLDQNETDGPLFKMRHDPRVTRVGRVIRVLSIDEFPQFWNVIRGEMSIVGPRPAIPSERVGWDDELFDRLRVLPGITGMWQVSGRSAAGFDQYKRHDLYYVDNWSLAHDIQIVAKTFVAVLLHRGAS